SIPLDLLVGDGPSVATDVRLRCLAGTPYVAVRVANTDDAALDVDVATAYGSRSFTGIVPGSSAYQSFAVRTTPSAGVVTVTARTAGGGTEHVERIEHAAPTC